MKNKRVLITCGPTWIPIDPVRVLSNRSTAQLGQILARDLNQQGARVTVLLGPAVQEIPAKAVRIIRFCFFDELFQLLEKELRKNYDIVIHAAAVSDYQLKKPKKNKLSSRLKRLKLELIPAPKLIERIKKINPKIFLIGFKLEPRLSKETACQKAGPLFEKAGCDLVVANSVDHRKYKGWILNRKRQILAFTDSRENLSKALIKILTDR